MDDPTGRAGTVGVPAPTGSGVAEPARGFEIRTWGPRSGPGFDLAVLGIGLILVRVLVREGAMAAGVGVVLAALLVAIGAVHLASRGRRGAGLVVDPARRRLVQRLELFGLVPVETEIGSFDEALAVAVLVPGPEPPPVPGQGPPRARLALVLADGNGLVLEPGPGDPEAAGRELARTLGVACLPGRGDHRLTIGFEGGRPVLGQSPRDEPAPPFSLDRIHVEWWHGGIARPGPVPRKDDRPGGWARALEVQGTAEDALPQLGCATVLMLPFLGLGLPWLATCLAWALGFLGGRVQDTVRFLDVLNLGLLAFVLAGPGAGLALHVLDQVLVALGDPREPPRRTYLSELGAVVFFGGWGLAFGSFFLIGLHGYATGAAHADALAFGGFGLLLAGSLQLAAARGPALLGQDQVRAALPAAALPEATLAVLRRELTAGDRPCPYCREPMRPVETVACNRCQLPHHAECWGEAGSCTAYSCDQAEATPLGPGPGTESGLS